jgi:hypothetical protein
MGDQAMKAIILAIGLMSILTLGNHEAAAQMYDPYSYGAYWDGAQYQPYPQYQPNPYPQQYDPYYDLHVIHYQLYLQQYPGYPVFYPTCCFVTGIPVLSAPVIRPPRPMAAPRPLPFRPH